MAGAISGTTIAAITAMLAGAAMQYKANQDAAKRQEQEMRASLARQAEFQQQAERKAMDTAQEFRTDNRSEKQQQIEENLNQEFIKPVESAQQINSAQSTTQGNVSNDYTVSKAQSELRVAKEAQALARILAKTTAPGKLRVDEAIRMSDAAGDIDRLGNFSRGQEKADEWAIEAAGVPNAGMMLGGQALGAIGAIGAAGGFNGLLGGGGQSSAAATAADWTAKTGTTGLKAGVPIGGATGPIGTTVGGVGFGAGKSGIVIPKSFMW